jgi:hypothetical protein
MFLLMSFSLKAQLFPNLGGQRVGIAAYSFLKTDVNARSVAMGGASVTLTEDAFGALNNPASLIRTSETSIALGNYSYGWDMHQSYLSAVLPRGTNSFGLSVNMLNSGAMDVRTEFQPQGTGEVFYVSNTSVMFNYAKELSDNFSFGIGIKYLNEQIAQYTSHNAAADLGFLYQTDFKDLRFAVFVQNFGGKSSISGDFFELDFNRDTSLSPDIYNMPTVFKLGLSFVPWKKDNHSIRFAAQLNHPNDNAENIRLGLEYSYNNLLFARTGYKINLKGQTLPAFGLGYRTRIANNPLYINYAMNLTNFLGVQHAIGVAFHFYKAKDRE